MPKQINPRVIKLAFAMSIAIVSGGIVLASLWFFLPSPNRQILLVVGLILILVGASSYSGMAKLVSPEHPPTGNSATDRETRSG